MFRNAVMVNFMKVRRCIPDFLILEEAWWHRVRPGNPTQTHYTDSN
jgi:hypothetical protein